MNTQYQRHIDGCQQEYVGNHEEETFNPLMKSFPRLDDMIAKRNGGVPD